MKHTIDRNFFPGFVRRSVSFTIDDGNLPLDRKLLSIVEPVGMRGTFNLNSDLCARYSPQELRDTYRRHEISNHCKYHADLISQQMCASAERTPFSEATAEKGRVYPHATAEGLYRYYRSVYWATGGDFSHYCRYEREGREELERIFGVGSVRGYVYPDGDQKSEELKRYLIGRGYYGIRITGCVGADTGFALSADRAAWSYNADYRNLEKYAALYDALPDDGEPKFFAFGVHSHDFENAGRWDVLEAFAERIGNRPQDFYYAPIGEIFAYRDAADALSVSEHEVFNPSSVDLSLMIDGVPTVLHAGERLPL